jgi:hypothetical protein
MTQGVWVGLPPDTSIKYTQISVKNLLLNLAGLPIYLSNVTYS